jgi:hypothetical protein
MNFRLAYEPPVRLPTVNPRGCKKMERNSPVCVQIICKQSAMDAAELRPAHLLKLLWIWQYKVSGLAGNLVY